MILPFSTTVNTLIVFIIIQLKIIPLVAFQSVTSSTAFSSTRRTFLIHPSKTASITAALFHQRQNKKYQYQQHQLQMETGTEPTWCEEQQIYINGTIASSSHAQDHIDSILASIDRDIEETATKNAPQLHIFGYGSLCWKPGTDDEVLANDRVLKTVAKAIGWKRCWCQQSTDHRGNVSFPGLVCTLLSDDEVLDIKHEQQKRGKMQQQQNNQINVKNNSNNDFNGGREDKNSVTMTEGVLYTIPSDLVKRCLAELDFREKGGYARDVIDVMVVNNDDASNVQYQKALLYRGTPDNPAFSKRALLDSTYAASIIAAAKGPSGPNDEYLFSLDEFLSSTATNTQTDTAHLNDDEETSHKTQIGDLQTKYLASITHTIQKHHDLYFLLGAGSNQHNQLLLEHTDVDFYGDYVNAADLVNGEDVHLLNDIFLFTPKSSSVTSTSTFKPSLNDTIRPKALYAGGGHSALLSENNELYLWGWNEYGQLGRRQSLLSLQNSDDIISNKLIKPKKAAVIEPLANVKVSKASLGQSHTLIIEHLTGKLYCFGDDGRGQVSGTIAPPITGEGEGVTTPVIISPLFAMNDTFVDVAAGVFHSAAITTDGELVTFGCMRFNQSLPRTANTPSSSSSQSNNDDERRKHDSVVGRWKPEDGSKLIKVACGRRHTVVLDEHGRIWTMGENKKYGQLGRSRTKCKKSHIPELVDGPLGRKGSGCIHIDCGWSHTIATVITTTTADNDDDKTAAANDKQQSELRYSMYGWGRSDKSQFGINHKGHKDLPSLICNDIDGKPLQQRMVCGAESVMVIDQYGDIYGCGWNEHGNLATGCTEDVTSFTKISGVKIRNFGMPLEQKESNRILLAAGGAHFLVTIV